MPACVANRHRLAWQRRVVLELGVAESRSWIEHPRFESGPGEFDDRMMHTDARRFGGGRYAADALEELPAASSTAASPSAAGGARLSRKRQLGFHLGILWKRAETRTIDAAAARLEPVAARLQTS